MRYRHARVLLLASQTWTCDRIAEALGLPVNTVRHLIETFNQGGLEAVTPRSRSGGRPPAYGSDVAEAAEDLLRQPSPPDEGPTTWSVPPHACEEYGVEAGKRGQTYGPFPLGLSSRCIYLDSHRDALKGTRIGRSPATRHWRRISASPGCTAPVC